MSAKHYISKEDRALYIKYEAKRVCTSCDKGDRCRSMHEKRVVVQWICKICSKEYTSKAAVIRHMQEMHERKRKTHTNSGPRILCECDKEFSTMHQYYEHQKSVHAGERGRKRRQTKEGQEPDLKRAKTRVGAEDTVKDLLVKINAQLQSKH